MVRSAPRQIQEIQALTRPARDAGPASGSDGVAQRAFADYDLTFLAHASVEKGVSPLDLWLDRRGLSSDRVLSARIGGR